MIYALVAVAIWSLFLNHSSSLAHALQHGLPWLMGTRDEQGKPDATLLEQRVSRAHRNHMENLMVFFPVALLVLQAGHGNHPYAAALAWAFFGARVGHLAFYAAGIPPLRSVTHVVGLCVYAGMFAILLGLI